ncbi:MAG: efflux RND transporter permease subunit [Polyangiaceae bacterium]|nr:efflux RND transporter permease subunit [Polyangiaceae bacterium]
MNITETCIRKPVLAWMLMAGAVVFGIIAMRRIGVSQLPDVDFPNITVSVTREGAAPEMMEHDVVEILEEALVQVEGVKSLTSTSRQGSANITVELDLAREVDVALQDAQTKVSQAGRRLPRDIDPPIISKSNPEDQPIMWVGVSGPYSRQVVSDYARYRIKERLQTVPGVGEIILGGYLERNIRIWVNGSALDERGLTVGDVVSALQRQHVELPAGLIQATGREINVRVLGEAIDTSELENIVVRSDARAPVRLKDVALVEDGFEDERRIGRLAGAPAQGMGVKKQRGANAVAVAQAVKTELEAVQASLPDGMRAQVMFDTSRFIEESVHEIEFELILAVLLTALVCWMFLGSLSSTLNVVLAIPMSLLGTIAIIYFLGYTLNTFTLLALSLAVGIVVDDAIMVLENIVRHGEMGKDRVTAAREGTREITFAAMSATLAVCAIFLPVAFMTGVIGKFFMQFGVTLSIAVMLSYLEAVTLAPARCAQFLDVGRHGRSFLGRQVDRAFDGLRRVYAWLLRGALRSWYGPAVVLVAASALLGGTVVGCMSLQKEFSPAQDQSSLIVRLQTAVGASLDETDRLVRQAEAVVNGRPEIARAFVVVGGFGGAGVNTGMMFITLVPPKERKVTQQEFAGVLRKELNAFPGLKAVVQDLSLSGLTGQRGFPVEFSVRGHEWEQIVAASDEVRRKLKESGVVVDIDTDYQLGLPELRVTPDRARAADMGVSIDSIATTLNALVGGARIGKYSTGGRRIDVRVRLLADQRDRPESLGKLRVRSDSGALLPMASLVSQEEQPSLQAITRRDRERAVTVFANVAPGHSQDEALALVESLAKDMPEGARIVLGGASVAFRESLESFLFAFILGIAVAYMILAAQFNSLVHPMTVLTILPLAAAGAVGALLVAGHSLNMYSIIGLLLLTGIVKKNSIILVDYALEVRRETGCTAREAMAKAGPVRLRPIIMTSASTMMAALPAALALGAGSETRGPMAVAVLGGLILSTLLSLLVVPASYVFADWLLGLARRGWQALRRWLSFGRPAPSPGA